MPNMLGQSLYNMLGQRLYNMLGQCLYNMLGQHFLDEQSEDGFASRSQRWPNENCSLKPNVGPTSTCEQRTNVCPTCWANVCPTCWAYVCTTCWANIFLDEQSEDGFASRNQRWPNKNCSLKPNVGPTSTCYLGLGASLFTLGHVTSDEKKLKSSISGCTMPTTLSHLKPYTSYALC